MKTLLDLAPLAAFFGAWVAGGIYAATAALIAACVVQCVLLRVIFGRVEKMNLAVCALTAVLGGLTLALQNAAFILVKPTVVYAVFAAALLAADFGFKKNLIQMMMEKFFTVPQPLWRKASCAWAGFFALCAVVNLWAAFSLSEAAWVKTKTFGFPIATFLFALAQVGIVSAKSQADESASAGAKPKQDSDSKTDSVLESKPVLKSDSSPGPNAKPFGGSGSSLGLGLAGPNAKPFGDSFSLKSRIIAKLAALNPLEVEVQDESAKHRGHAEAGSGAHFRIRVVSQKFAGLSHLQRHRLIYQAVGKPADIGLHALAVRALTPDEAAPHFTDSPNHKGETPC